jgi:hypothetical protein
MRAAQEKRVSEHVAQPAQALADRRLGEAKFARDIKGFPVPEQPKKDQKQGQVQPSELRFA